MTDRNGELVQQYGYTAFGQQRFKHNINAFNVTSRYTGQQVDDDTGLYFYKSRYYDPQLARFTQADTIVPSANTSQALNRYTYVENNPLKFTDPSGHGSFWKKIRKWIGVIVSVALIIINPAFFLASNALFGLSGLFWAGVIGSAVSTVVNGGNWKNFAIGVGIGFATGGVIDALGGAVAGIGNLASQVASQVAGGTADWGAKLLYGAIAGAIAGAISSVVYGVNVGKGMTQGLYSGLVGSGIGIAVGRAVNWAKNKMSNYIKTRTTARDWVKGFGKATTIDKAKQLNLNRDRNIFNKAYPTLAGARAHPELFELESSNGIYHKGRITFRGKVGTQVEGSQASYYPENYADSSLAGRLDDSSIEMGTFDYIPPGKSPIGHVIVDMIPHHILRSSGANYTPNLTNTNPKTW